MNEPVNVKFDLLGATEELQFLGVLAQVADLFSHNLTAEEMARVTDWFHAKYGSKA